MDLSFVILTWNSRQHIDGCLESLFSSISDKMLYEVLIVDNGSRDGTVELLKGYQSKYPSIVKPIYLDSNRGTTYPRNLALKEAKGEYVVVVDSDVVFVKGALERLIDALGEDETLGMAVPRLVYESGKLQKSTDFFPTLSRKIVRYFFLKAIEKEEDKNRDLSSSPITVDYAISAFWVVPKRIIESVGMLDERIFYAPEDVDYCLRIWKAGYRILYFSDVYAIHNAQEISRGFKLNKAMIEHIKGLVYLFMKHRYILRRPKFT